MNIKFIHSLFNHGKIFMKSSTEKVIPALVTPLNKNQTADLNGFIKLFNI